MRATIVVNFCLLILVLCSCKMSPKMENPPIRLADNDSLLNDFLEGNYEKVLRHCNRKLSFRDSLLCSCSSSESFLFENSEKYSPKISSIGYKFDQFECLQYSAQFAKCENALELLSLYFYCKNKSIKSKTVCCSGPLSLALTNDILDDSLPGFVFLECSYQDWKQRANSKLNREGSSKVDFINEVEKEFPDHFKVMIARAFDSHKQEYYENAVDYYRKALLFGKDTNLIKSSIAKCYQNYTGVKDTMYYDSLTHEKVYAAKEVPGFIGQSIDDSIKKYSSVSN